MEGKTWWNYLTKDRGKMIYGLVLCCIVGIFAFQTLGGEKEETIKEDTMTSSQYAKDCEERLEAILSKIAGVGKVQVMITLENNGEKVYVQESTTQSTLDQTGEESSEQQNTTSQTLVINGKEGEEAVVSKEMEPKIQGVVVVCSGGASQQVQLTVTESVKTLLGVSASDICVVQAKN